MLPHVWAEATLADPSITADTHNNNFALFIPPSPLRVLFHLDNRPSANDRKGSNRRAISPDFVLDSQNNPKWLFHNALRRYH
jgi:hypothetical protein